MREIRIRTNFDCKTVTLQKIIVIANIICYIEKIFFSRIIRTIPRDALGAHFQGILDSITERKCKAILCGDFNLDLLSYSVHNYTAEYAL